MASLCRFCGRVEAGLDDPSVDDGAAPCRRSAAFAVWLRDGDFAAMSAHQDACDLVSPLPAAARV